MFGFLVKMFGVCSAFSVDAMSSTDRALLASENPDFWETLGMVFASLFRKIGNWFLDLLFTLIFVVSRFVLNIVEFLTVAVKELAGQNAISDLANLKNASQADMVFRFIFDSTILNIFKSILALSVVLIIVFAIVAIIKNEYDAFLGGEENNSKRQVVVKMLTSVFLIVIVPFIAFAGILLSNAVLKSVDNALGQASDNSSIATEVFIASSYSSNRYRLYADSNERIPILFDFKSVDKVDFKLPEGGQSYSEMSSAMEAFLNKGVWTRGLTTWLQFYNEQFFTFEDIDSTKIEVEELGTISWYDFFDKNLQINKAEYYVMADLVDHLIRTRNNVYIVNVFSLAEQVGLNNGVDGGTSPFYGYDRDGNRTTQIDNAVTIKFRVYYNDDLVEKIPGMKIENNRYFLEYTSNNTHDEAQGALYVFCSGEWMQSDDGTKSFVYTPLLNNDKAVNNFSGKFYSNYLDPNQVVVARGCFDEDGYPTAIRENNGQIEFYRDLVVAPSLFDLLPQITYEDKDGKFNLAGGVSTIIEGIIGLDLSELIPKVYFRDDAWNFFTKRTVVAFALDSNVFALDYNFSQGVPLFAVQDVGEMNILVLVFASLLLCWILAKAVFGLISRIFDLVMLFIAYPAVAATMPLDQGKRFSQWTSNFVGKVLGAYGILIGINFVFILLPVIAGMNTFFSREFIANNIKPTTLSVDTVTNLFNLWVWLMFYLVAFIFLDRASSIVSNLIGSSSDLMNDGEEVMGDIKKLLHTTAGIISGKTLVEGAKKLAGDVAGFVPGSAVVRTLVGKEARKKRKTLKELKARKNALIANLKTGNASNLKSMLKKK